jgi:hypothetical protein
MTKSKSSVIIGMAAIISVFVAVYLYLKHEENKEKIAELEEDKLKLILDSLKRNADLSEEVKSQLERLIEQFRNVDEKVSNELTQSLQLLQIGQTENAIEDLVKIIEHLLVTHYKNSAKCKKWLKTQNRRFDLHNLLCFCKEEDKISDIEFQFFIAIKTIRNKEDHTLDLKLDNYLNASGLLAAIGGIFKIASIVYPKDPILLHDSESLQYPVLDTISKVEEIAIN